MVAEHPVAEESAQFFSCNHRRAGNEVPLLGQVIYHYTDSVVALGLG